MKPHADAWSLESRRQMMRDVIARMAKDGTLHLIAPPAFAATYGLKEAECTAEMMRHLSEGENI